MKLSNILTAVCVLGISAMLAGCNGSNPTLSGASTGQVKISIMGLAGGDGNLAKSFADDIEITSAKVVIEKIEFENEQDTSLDFKFEEPFVQDLVTITTLEEIETVEIPFGVYDRVKIDIDDLDSEDGEVFNQNPELQNLSVQVQGFLNNDPGQSFEFTSDLSANVDLEFDPPLEINEQVLSTNIVLGIDFANWFRGRNGSFLDPTRAENRSEIENNIKRSLRVFEDRDEDGRRDDRGRGRDDDDEDVEVKGVIHALNDSSLVVSGRTFHVDANTVIEGDDDHLISFADLAVGFLVEVHALRREDGTLLATRIEVEDNFGRHDEIKGTISELGEDFLVVSGRTFFVDERTVFLGDDHRGRISFSDLQVGFFVEVHAIRQSDDTFLAVKVEVEDDFDDDDNDDEDVEVKAPITEIGTDFIVVSGLTFFVDANTVITGDDGQIIGLGDLMVGFFVEIHADRRADGSLLALRIEVEDDLRGDDDDDVDVRGIIMEIGESRLVVADVEFFVNAQTEIEDDDGNRITLSDLEVGMFVKIEGRRQTDGTLLATEIEIDDDHGHDG